MFGLWFPLSLHTYEGEGGAIKTNLKALIKYQTVIMQDRIELYEQLEIEQYERKVIKPLTFNLDRFSKPKATRPPRNEREALINEIRGIFGQDIGFAMMLGIIRNKGLACVREVFYETLKKAEHGEVENPRAYFFGWLKKIKVNLKPVPSNVLSAEQEKV